MDIRIRLTGALLALLLPGAFLPGGLVRAQERPAEPQFLHYIVENGDTVFVETLRPVWKWAAGKHAKRDWKRYTRLVYNFSKVYPYAILARDLVTETDSVFIAEDFGRRKKEKYVNVLQKKLFSAYEKPLKNMTVTQGQLMMKLIDREVGKSSYLIIKDYKSGIAAGFWQGIAKMFGSDLKAPYDPSGADRDTEDLVRKWERGEFPFYYYSIFGEFPKTPSSVRSSTL